MEELTKLYEVGLDQVLDEVSTTPNIDFFIGNSLLTTCFVADH